MSPTKKAESQPLIGVARQAVVQQAQELFAHMVESFARGYSLAATREKRVAAPKARARKKSSATAGGGSGKTSKTKTSAKEAARGAKPRNG
jgi:hypothetical protein